MGSSKACTQKKVTCGTATAETSCEPVHTVKLTSVGSGKKCAHKMLMHASMTAVTSCEPADSEKMSFDTIPQRPRANILSCMRM